MSESHLVDAFIPVEALRFRKEVWLPRFDGVDVAKPVVYADQLLGCLVETAWIGQFDIRHVLDGLCHLCGLARCIERVPTGCEVVVEKYFHLFLSAQIFTVVNLCACYGCCVAIKGVPENY